MGRRPLPTTQVRVRFCLSRVAPKTKAKLMAWKQPGETMGRLIDRLVDRLL